MDAKQAVEILRKNTLPAWGEWSVRNDLADLVESLAANALLGEEVINVLDNLPGCKGEFDREICRFIRIKASNKKCHLETICRLHAGGGAGVIIIRIFPRRTEMTPLDSMAFSPKDEKDDGDFPGLFIPDHDSVHICCVFTWDIERAKNLQCQWQGKTNKPVLLDGPAFGNSGGDFVPGMYVKQGVTFTSRGCPNNCGFCFVPKREGKLRQLSIYTGNIINDNNFLACSVEHKRKVYDMLKTQRAIEFKGGLEAARLKDRDIEELRGLRIKKMFFACDHDGAIPTIQRTAERLYVAGYKRDHLHCYVLIGDDMAKNEERLKAVYRAGMLPRPQLYQPEQWVEYSQEWSRFARRWSRPAIYKAIMAMEELG